MHWWVPCAHSWAHLFLWRRFFFSPTFHPRFIQLGKRLFSAAYECLRATPIVSEWSFTSTIRKQHLVVPTHVGKFPPCFLLRFLLLCVASWFFMWPAAHVQQFEQVPGNQVSWWTGNSTIGYPKHAAHEKWSWQMHTLNASNLGTWNTPIISIFLRLSISCPTWLAKCLLRCWSVIIKLAHSNVPRPRLPLLPTKCVHTRRIRD